MKIMRLSPGWLEQAVFLLVVFSATVFSVAISFAQRSSELAPAVKFPLRNGWMLQSSAKVAATGEAISSPSFNSGEWMTADVPTTVVAVQVKSGLLPDPFFGMNLRQYPGVSYPIGANFSNIAMPRDSPYAVSWWYRKEFALPDGFAGKTVWLHFSGINYRANIFLNGKEIADSKRVAGAWRTYEFNVSSAVKSGTNVLAVQVWAPTENSLAITFVDWNPMPPDKDMGLWREVYLTTSWAGRTAASGGVGESGLGRRRGKRKRCPLDGDGAGEERQRSPSKRNVERQN